MEYNTIDRLYLLNITNAFLLRLKYLLFVQYLYENTFSEKL